MLCLPAAVRGADYYLAPPGSNSGGTPRQNSASNPIEYDLPTVQNIIRGQYQSGDPEVVLYFTPGTYLIESLVVPSNTPADRELVLRAADPAQRPLLKYRAPTVNEGAQPASLFVGPAWMTWLINGALVEIARFEARDLVLDANWPAWAATNTAASPAYVGGFALNALRAKAREGRIANVWVRHCGARGKLPNSYLTLAGVEAFPLWIHATDFAAADGAWVIEDCEISDFHAVQGGYATLIMATVFFDDDPDPDTLPDHRPVVIRRCQVRGPDAAIAFGSARSAGVSVHDNVALRVALGMNHDSVPGSTLRSMDLTNNIFLDVSKMANVGAPGWSGATDDHGVTRYRFRNYRINANRVRLRGVALSQNYRDYEWIMNTIGDFTALMPVTDPSLVVGRFQTGHCAGVSLGGVGSTHDANTGEYTHRVAISNNVFTTRPRADFYEPDPANTAAAKWTPIYRPPQHWTTHQTMNQSGHIYVAGNTLSSVAMDFTGLAALSVVTTNQPDALAALADPPAGFIPGGWPGRVRLLTNATGQLTGVREVQLGRPSAADGVVTVTARVVDHPTALSGGESAPLYPDQLRLRILAGPSMNITNQAPVSWTNDLATFTYPAGAVNGRDHICVYWDEGNGFDPDATAWAETEILLGTTVRFDRAPDVADDRRLTEGTLRITRGGPTGAALNVLLEPVTSGAPRLAQPGDDYDLRDAGGTLLVQDAQGRWTAAIPAGAAETTLRVRPRAGGLRHTEEHEVAGFRIVTNAAYAVAPPAPRATPLAGGGVAVTFWDGPKYKITPLDDSYSGYGYGAASGGGETAPALTPEEAAARLAEVAAGERSPQDPGLVALAAQGLLPEKTVRELGIAPAVPMADALRWSRLPEPPPVADLPAQGTDLQPGSAAAGGETYDSGGSPSLYAIRVFGLNQSANALRAAGYSYWYDYGGYYSSFPLGGTWKPDDGWSDLSAVGSAGNSPYILAVADDQTLAGYRDNQPIWVSAQGTTGALPLPPNGTGGEALAIAPDALAIAGWCRQSCNGTSCYRAVRWNRSGNAWTAALLGDFDGNTTTSGFNAYAYGVNNSGVVAGKCQRDTGESAPVYRAFRTLANQGVNSAPPLGLPPVHEGKSEGPMVSAARGINRTGDAVGIADIWYVRADETNREPRAVIWWNGESKARPLGTIQPGSKVSADQRPGRSEALAVSRDERGVIVVGTGWTTPTGYSRAFMMKIADRPGNHDRDATHAKMVNLNDPHISWSSYSGITLISAEAVNDAGVIVANGDYETSGEGSRGWGFVLEPQGVAAE